MKKSIKLGLIPTRRDLFSKENAIKQKNMIKERLTSLNIDFIDLDWLNREGLMFDMNDIDTIAERFKAEKVDALFAPHCNFGNENCVAAIGRKMGLPMLIWGPRDGAPLSDGTRERDSQCGLFATSKVLQRYNVPFSYIENCKPEDEKFEKGIKKFLSAAKVVKAFKGMRIGQIGTRPESFLSVMYNEGSMLERLGIEIIPISILDFINMAKKLIAENDKRVLNGAAYTKNRIEGTKLSNDFYVNHAAIKYAIIDFVNSRNLSGVAIQCWNSLQTEIPVMPCLAMSELSEEGIPVACETDVMGAVTAVLVNVARSTDEPMFFSDITVRHPENDNAELLWHCGPFPYSLKNPESKAAIGDHYVLENNCYGVCEWELKRGNVTIVRLDESHGNYKLLLANGKAVDGPKNRGTYVWTEFSNWAKLEEKLIYGPYIHHVACIYEDISPALKEATRYIPQIEIDEFI